MEAGAVSLRLHHGGPQGYATVRAPSRQANEPLLAQTVVFHRPGQNGKRHGAIRAVI
jgi:hypothetical protein